MEFVFVVKRRVFEDELRLPDGFEPLELEAAKALIARLESHGFFVERRHAEQDPELKQLIPYCLVHESERMLCVRRTKAGSEGRLHGKCSVGFGGHIEPEDVLPPSQGSDAPQNRPSTDLLRGLVGRATSRELHEELVLSATPNSPRMVPHPIGWLNDDSNAVGAVHLGLVFRLPVREARVSIRERDRLEGDFRGLNELRSLAASGATSLDEASLSEDAKAPQSAASGLGEGNSRTDTTAIEAARDEAKCAGTSPTHSGMSSSRSRHPNLPSLANDSSTHDSSSSTAALPSRNDAVIPSRWEELESWSRFVIQALRPGDLDA